VNPADEDPLTRTGKNAKGCVASCAEALTTSLGTEIGFRKWKNSSGVDDSRSSSPSGYGRRIPQHQIHLIPDPSQNRGDLRMDGNGNGERVEQSAVG